MSTACKGNAAQRKAWFVFGGGLLIFVAGLGSHFRHRMSSNEAGPVLALGDLSALRFQLETLSRAYTKSVNLRIEQLESLGLIESFGADNGGPQAVQPGHGGIKVNYTKMVDGSRVAKHCTIPDSHALNLLSMLSEMNCLRDAIGEGDFQFDSSHVRKPISPPER